MVKMFKLSSSLLFLILISGCAHAAVDDAIVLRAGNEDFPLGAVSAGTNEHSRKIALRAVSGSGFCRDASFKIDFDQFKKAVAIDFDSMKWIYRFPGAKDEECGDGKSGGYSLEFNPADGSEIKEVDFALASILKVISAKSVPSNVVILDEAKIIDCVVRRGNWTFAEIYSDFGTKMDDDGTEMKQRMPSVVFHVVSRDEKSRCRDAYLLAFFPEESRKTYFFVTGMAALPRVTVGGEEVGRKSGIYRYRDITKGKLRDWKEDKRWNQK